MTRLLRTARMALFGLLAAIAAVPAYAESFYVAGHGGVPLAVTVVGPENSPEILFIHGLGFGGESFSPQLQSDLAARYRMVAFDLRGHAMSGKPWNAEDYVKRGVWAEDVQRVIAAAHLKRPVIVGWSYGTLVAADYVLAKGPNAISGLVLVSALGGLVPPTPPAGTPDPAIIAQLNRSRALRSSPRLADQEEANRLLAPLLFETTPTGPSKEWQAQALSLGLLVAPYAQPHLRNHPVNNSALVAQLAKTPLLIIHGSKDLAVSDADLAKLKKYLPRAAVRSFKSAGHSPFAEQPAAFNAVLSNFVTANWKPVDDRYKAIHKFGGRIIRRCGSFCPSLVGDLSLQSTPALEPGQRALCKGRRIRFRLCRPHQTAVGLLPRMDRLEGECPRACRNQQP